MIQKSKGSMRKKSKGSMMSKPKGRMMSKLKVIAEKPNGMKVERRDRKASPKAIIEKNDRKACLPGSLGQA